MTWFIFGLFSGVAFTIVLILFGEVLFNCLEDGRAVMPKRRPKGAPDACTGGIVGCRGGENCTSDHK